MGRIHYVIDDELHRNTKALAARRGQTFKSLIIELMDAELKRNERTIERLARKMQDSDPWQWAFEVAAQRICNEFPEALQRVQDAYSAGNSAASYVNVRSPKGHRVISQFIADEQPNAYELNDVLPEIVDASLRLRTGQKTWYPGTGHVRHVSTTSHK